MTELVEEHLNKSVIPLHHGEEHLLAPGFIAAVTIGSMFIFYFTIMMIVCLGEWYQYTHGKKGKPAFTSNSSRSSNSTNQNRRLRNYSNTDASASQSDARASSSAFRSDESSTNNIQSRMSRNDIVIVENEEEFHIEQCINSNEGAANRLETQKNTDLDDNVSNNVTEIEVSTIPLLSTHSSEVQIKDDDISESVESYDFHKLEATV